jgi:hypothetical protein
MNENIEIIPIAIPVIHYNRYVANLVENLLAIDDKLSTQTKSGVA